MTTTGDENHDIDADAKHEERKQQIQHTEHQTQSQCLGKPSQQQTNEWVDADIRYIRQYSHAPSDLLTNDELQHTVMAIIRGKPGGGDGVVQPPIDYTRSVSGTKRKRSESGCAGQGRSKLDVKRPRISRIYSGKDAESRKNSYYQYKAKYLRQRGQLPYITMSQSTISLPVLPSSPRVVEESKAESNYKQPMVHVFRNERDYNKENIFQFAWNSSWSVRGDTKPLFVCDTDGKLMQPGFTIRGDDNRCYERAGKRRKKKNVYGKKASSRNTNLSRSMQRLF